jgi:capsular exopolysaccharide synthesis family protein
MSRIDEAFKRSSSPLTSRGTGELGDLQRYPADERSLDEYPGELPQAVRQIRGGDHVATRPAAAPVNVSTNDATRSNARLSEDSQGKVVVGSKRNAVALEQYRRLAATLHDAQVEKGLKAIVVTSSIPREGKTLTAVNLALTLTESYGRRVLLIDADLRCPRLHQMFGIPNNTGLTDVLRVERIGRAAVSVSEASKSLSPLLTLLPSGRPDPNPQAGLSSDRMRQLVDDCAQRFDWVILDTPPLALQSDAQLLARLTQAVVFVIRARSTPFPVVDRAVAELGRDCIIGTVLNGVDEASLPDIAYYGDYHKESETED